MLVLIHCPRDISKTLNLDFNLKELYTYSWSIILFFFGKYSWSNI